MNTGAISLLPTFCETIFVSAFFGMSKVLERSRTPRGALTQISIFVLVDSISSLDAGGQVLKGRSNLKLNSRDAYGPGLGPVYLVGECNARQLGDRCGKKCRPTDTCVCRI
jgi:hypothetical protein